MRRHRCPLDRGVGGLEARLVLGQRQGDHHRRAAASEAFPRCVGGLRQGRLSLDQVGVIAARAADGSDEHYAQLASVATVNQLRTAVKLEPRPDPDPAARPPSRRSLRAPMSSSPGGGSPCPTTRRRRSTRPWRRIARRWSPSGNRLATTAITPRRARRRCPNTVDAFLRLVEAGWDAEVARRPHGQHTTVVVHVDVEQRAAALHLGPLLSDAERQYLTCDATCEVWFERDGRPIGVGRATRTVSRRLRRALEHRDRSCAVPGCGATRGLHAHHIRHWEDGGPTELDKPGPALPVSPPGTPPRRHHHHRTRRQSRRHRQ